MCDSEVIEPHHLSPECQQVLPRPSSADIPQTWEEFKAFKRRMCESTIEELECRFIMEALERSKGNVSKAAQEVGIQRTNFHALMRKYGLTSEDLAQQNPE